MRSNWFLKPFRKHSFITPPPSLLRYNQHLPEAVQVLSVLCPLLRLVSVQGVVQYPLIHYPRQSDHNTPCSHKPLFQELQELQYVRQSNIQGGGSATETNAARLIPVSPNLQGVRQPFFFSMIFRKYQKKTDFRLDNFSL